MLVSVVQQSESAICIHISPYPLPLASPSHAPYPIPLGVAKHRADLPVLRCCFPLANYFTFGSVYMSMLLSHFIHASPSPSPCPQVHSKIRKEDNLKIKIDVEERVVMKNQRKHLAPSNLILYQTWRKIRSFLSIFCVVLTQTGLEPYRGDFQEIYHFHFS